MSIPTIQFEAKKHSYRQVQDGVVVSFVVHPNDVHAGFAVAPLGTRYQVVIVQLGDDDQPVPPGALQATQGSVAKGDSPPTPDAPGGATKGGWYGLKPSARAALLCKDEAFRAWINETYKLGAPVDGETEVAEWLRIRCKVHSRGHLDPMTPGYSMEAQSRFLGIERAYREARGLETRSDR